MGAATESIIVSGAEDGDDDDDDGEMLGGIIETDTQDDGPEAVLFCIYETPDRCGWNDNRKLTLGQDDNWLIACYFIRDLVIN